jgi:FG-GAP-like repeat
MRLTLRLMKTTCSFALATSLAALASPAAAGPVAPSCPQTSSPTTWTGVTLDTSTTKSGTMYDGPSAVLQLNHAGSVFNTKQMTTTSSMVYAAVGDFNKDGWPDFVGANENSSTGYLDVFQNYTWQNENCTTAECTAYSGAQPNWADPTVVVTPKFTNVRSLHAAGFQGRYAIAAADFNGDGWDDVIEFQAPSSAYQLTTVNLYTNKAVNDASSRPTFNTAYNPITGISSYVGVQSWSGTNINTLDWNADGFLDILLGSGAQGGSIRIFKGTCTKADGAVQNAAGLWPCTGNFTLSDQGYLISNLSTNHTPSTADGFGTNTNGGLPTFAYADVDLDGKRDLIVGAPNCCSTAAYRLRLFKGVSATAVESVASQSLTSTGAVTGVFVADYSQDGKPDLIVATDGHNYSNSVNGGTTYYYVNNGTNTPFSGGVKQQITLRGSPNTDYDVGFIFDYDRDPTRSPDLMVADGNDSAGYYVIADRQSTTYVDCGEAASGVVDLGSLLTAEMVVTAARITPSFVLDGGTISFYMSNEDPANWVKAELCPSSSTDYCAAFPRAAGRSVRWKVVMCSNSNHTTTPKLSGMTAKFDYTMAKEHYRAGIVVNDGVAYVGAFSQPGERGRFYAINAGLSTVLWDAGAKLDATPDASRKIYTAINTVPQLRYDFASTSASDLLLQTLLTTGLTGAGELISWVRSARFGVGNSSIPLTKLGAVENSTPAVLSRPGRPSWYSFGTGADRAHVDAFVSANANRVPLVMFGSKDGMIHAVYTFPSNQSDSRNGKEAWAYVPPTIAGGMLADLTATLNANAIATDGLNHPAIAAFPDGSPTLVDYQTAQGTFKTVALISEGNGGKAFSVLDVTRTVDPVTGSVLGPTPMWSATPGLGEAGQSYGKPTVVRVKINGAERYFVVTGTGVDYTDILDLKGRTVSAYDLATGSLMWKFQSKCPVTSDVSAFETDDTGELGSPTLDGFIDRIVFADKCGYVYKLAPGVDLGGAWYQNTGMGSIAANTTLDGKVQYALFSTKLSANGLGSDRAIAGTLAARTDATTRMVLFFGTGGIESVPATSANAFFAVYADTGAVRSRVLGSCSVSLICEKFYGGVVVTPEQVIFTKTVDPAIGTNSCDTGTSTISGVELNAGTGTNFTTAFNLGVNSAVMGGLYGDAGAIYFATISGDVARVGTPRASAAGGDTAAGRTQGTAAGDLPTGGATVGTTSPFTLMGWRVVL